MEHPFETLQYDSLTIARAIRYAADREGHQLNMTQIQKLLYIVYGTLLRVTKKRLTEEHPQAWPYGPIFPRVHRLLKLWEDITDVEYKELQEQYNGNINRIIDIVVENFAKETAGTLSAWSHEPGSPWALAVQRADGKWGEELCDEDIYNYFYSFVTLKTEEQNG